MATKAVSQQNHWGFWQEIGLGPNTLARIIDGQLPDGIPNWHTLQTGLSHSTEKSKWDFGLRLGSTFDQNHELGIVASPHHASHPNFQTSLGIVWTEFGPGLQEFTDGRFTPAVDFRLTLPSLWLGKFRHAPAIEPFVDASLLLGWDADPVAYVKGVSATRPFPHMLRGTAGIRFRLDPRISLHEEWDASRSAAVISEEALLLYPAVATAFLLGAGQAVFIDFPYGELQTLKEKNFPVEEERLMLDLPRREEWDDRLKKIEGGDEEEIKFVLKSAADFSAGAGALLGVINGEMSVLDSTLILAARRGEISPAVPHTVLATKAFAGAALLGVSLLQRDHPGALPAWGGHPPQEISNLAARPDAEKMERVANDFGEVGAAYLERSKVWAKDYRWRGAEYLGHALLLNAGIGAIDSWAELDPASTGYVLASLALGGGLAAVYGVVASNNPATYDAENYYRRARLSAHLTLAASTFLTRGVLGWLRGAGWSTF